MSIATPAEVETVDAGTSMSFNPVVLAGRFKNWFLYDAPTWLASTVIHSLVLIVGALVFGDAVMIQKSEAPAFEVPDEALAPEPVIDQFELGYTSL